MGDGHAHVRRPELGQNRTVDIGNHRVDNGLRMDQHVDVVRTDREQIGGLDQFEALVHHRR